MKMRQLPELATEGVHDQRDGLEAVEPLEHHSEEEGDEQERPSEASVGVPERAGWRDILFACHGRYSPIAMLWLFWRRRSASTRSAIGSSRSSSGTSGPGWGIDFLSIDLHQVHQRAAVEWRVSGGD